MHEGIIVLKFPLAKYENIFEIGVSWGLCYNKADFSKKSVRSKDLGKKTFSSCEFNLILANVGLQMRQEWL